MKHHHAQHVCCTCQTIVAIAYLHRINIYTSLVCWLASTTQPDGRHVAVDVCAVDVCCDLLAALVLAGLLVDGCYACLMVALANVERGLRKHRTP